MLLENYEIQLIPTWQVPPDPDNYRRSHNQLEALMESIRRDGILQAVGVVRKNPELYGVIFGNGRVICAHKLKMETIPARVFSADLTEAQYRRLALVENLCQSELLPGERAVGIRAYMQANGLTAKEAAAELAVSESSICNLLKVLDTPGLMALVDAGKLKLTSAGIIARIQDEQERLEMIRQAQEGGWSREQVQEAARSKLLPKRAYRGKGTKAAFKVNGHAWAVSGQEPLEIEGVSQSLGLLARQAKKAAAEGLSVEEFEKNINSGKA